MNWVQTEPIRKCAGPCGIELAESRFSQYRRWCKACVNRRKNERRKGVRTADDVLRSNLKQNYNLSPEWLVEQRERQGNRCACCGDGLETKHTHIHHGHRSGDVYHLLCYRCNSAEGFVKTPERAHKLWQYMESNALFYTAAPIPIVPKVKTKRKLSAKQRLTYQVYWAS